MKAQAETAAIAFQSVVLQWIVEKILSFTVGRILTVWAFWKLGYLVSEILLRSTFPEEHPIFTRVTFGALALCITAFVYKGYKTGPRESVIFRPLWTPGVFHTICVLCFPVGVLSTSVFTTMDRPGSASHQYAEEQRAANLEKMKVAQRWVDKLEAEIAREVSPTPHFIESRGRSLATAKRTVADFAEDEKRYAEGRRVKN